MPRFELREQGCFWRADEIIPDDAWAPQSALPGVLEINSSGRCHLLLTGHLPDAHGQIRFLPDRSHSVRNIRGRLTKTGRHVLLQEASLGEWRLGNPSYEGYVSLRCLIGQDEYGVIGGDPVCEQMVLDLDGLRDWLNFNQPRTKQTRSGSVACYKDDARGTYKITGARLHIGSRFERLPDGNDVSSSFALQAHLTYVPDVAIDLEQAVETHSRLTELFLLLTNREFKQSWPRIKLRNDSNEFLLVTSFQGEAKSTNSLPWTRFKDLKSIFGKLVDSWLARREEFGAAFYLYLGNRRGFPLYVENRLSNLVWGLEALAEKLVGPYIISTQTQQTIDQILQNVEASDRKSLRYLLKNWKKPKLESRLVELFEKLPLDLPPGTIAKLAADCANRRNDLSHTGASRVAGSYREAVHDFERLVRAVEPIYHALILQLIGFPPEQLDRILAVEGPVGHHIRSVLCPDALQEYYKTKLARASVDLSSADTS